jgi:hypothetical protein
MQPSLSIDITTYNRPEGLILVLQKLLSQIESLINKSQVEILVTDNSKLKMNLDGLTLNNEINFFGMTAISLVDLIGL